MRKYKLLNTLNIGDVLLGVPRHLERAVDKPRIPEQAPHVQRAVLHSVARPRDNIASCALGNYGGTIYKGF